MIKLPTIKLNNYFIKKAMFISFFLLSACNDHSQQFENIGSPENHLQMLRVSGAALSPTFEVTHKHYVSTADHSVTKISLQAWGKQFDAEIDVNGELLNNIGEFSLAVGNNLFTISVSNNEKIIEQYYLTVVRLPEFKNNNFKNSSKYLL